MGFKTTLVAEIKREYEWPDSKVYTPPKLHHIVFIPKAKNRDLQINRLVCHSFHGACRIHETPGSETEDTLLVTEIEKARIS